MFMMNRCTILHLGGTRTSREPVTASLSFCGGGPRRSYPHGVTFRNQLDELVTQSGIKTLTNTYILFGCETPLWFFRTEKMVEKVVLHRQLNFLAPSPRFIQC